MKTLTTDIPAIIRKWSPKQRQTALAALLNEYMRKRGSKIVPIEDRKETIGYLMPRLRSVPSVIDESTEYGREMRRRIDSRDDSIPIEELNAELIREAKTKRRSR